MLRNTDNKRLIQNGMTKKAERVFVQRWLELWDYQTVDSYATKLLNSNGAIEETTSVIEGILNDDISGKHLAAVLNETRQIVMSDRVLLSRNSVIVEQVRRILASTPKPNDQARLYQMLDELRDISRRLQSQYLEWIISFLRGALQNDSHVDAEYAAGVLASQLFVRRNDHSLYDLGLFLRQNLSNSWDLFEKIIRQPPQQMTVFASVVGDHMVLSRHAQLLNLSIVSRSEIARRGSHLSEFVGLLSDPAMVITVEAEDYRSAAFHARDQIDQDLDAFDLFLPNSKLRVPELMVVEYKSVRGQSKGARMVKAIRPHRWTPRGDELQTTLGIAGSRNPEVQQRIKSCIQHMRLGKRAHSRSTRYINMWVALESLIRGPGGPFDNIELYLPAVLCNQYSRYLLADFLNDCHKCKMDFVKLLGTATKDRDIQLRRLLARMTDSVHHTSLQDACSHHDLLALRITNLIDNFKTGPRVANMLRTHQQRLSWHLLRLYRIRNSIVHAGETPPSTVPCTRHLEDYVITAFREICRIMNKNNLNAIQSALAFSYNEYMMNIDELLSDNTYRVSILLDY